MRGRQVVVPEERDQSQGSCSTKRGRTEMLQTCTHQGLLDFSSPAEFPSLWDKKTEGLGERGLCSPTTPSNRNPWQEKELSHCCYYSISQGY